MCFSWGVCFWSSGITKLHFLQDTDSHASNPKLYAVSVIQGSNWDIFATIRATGCGDNLESKTK